MQKSIDNVNYSDRAPEDDVLDLIHTVMHQYRSQQYQELRDGPYDITHMESKVLSYFDRHPGTTQSDLAHHNGRDKAQLARLIRGLRERGFLTGEADEIDRRNVRMSLTSAGQAVQHALQQQAMRLSATAVAGFKATEHQQLLELLQRVRKNLDSPR